MPKAVFRHPMDFGAPYSRRRWVVALLAALAGATLGTIAWFSLSPHLSQGQESATSWFLIATTNSMWLVPMLVRRRTGRTSQPSQQS